MFKNKCIKKWLPHKNAKTLNMNDLDKITTHATLTATEQVPKEFFKELPGGQGKGVTWLPPTHHDHHEPELLATANPPALFASSGRARRCNFSSTYTCSIMMARALLLAESLNQGLPYTNATITCCFMHCSCRAQQPRVGWPALPCPSPAWQQNKNLLLITQHSNKTLG
jgi:hypothetical protein